MAKKASKKTATSGKSQAAPVESKKAAKKSEASLLPAVVKKGAKSSSVSTAIIVSPKRQVGPTTPEDRKAIMASMAPTTRTVVKAIDQLRVKGFELQLLVKYDIGAAIGEILTEVQASDTDVVMLREVQLLANYFGETMNSIYDHRNIAATFNKEFIVKALEKRLPDGTKLTWSHLRELQKIKDKTQKNLVWKQIFSEGLSAKQVSNLTKAEGISSTKKGGSGRNIKMPKKPKEIVQRGLSTIKTAKKFFEAFGTTMDEDGKLMHVAKKDCNARYIQQLADTSTSIYDTICLLTAVSAKLLEAQRYASQVSGIPLVVDGELTPRTAVAAKPKGKPKAAPPVAAEPEADEPEADELDDEPEVDTELSEDMDLEDDDDFEDADEDAEGDEDDDEGDDEGDDDDDFNEEDAEDSDDFDAVDGDDVAADPVYQSDDDDLD